MADRKKIRRKFDEVKIFVIYPINLWIHKEKILPAVITSGYCVLFFSGKR